MCRLLSLQRGSAYADIHWILAIIGHAAVGPLLYDAASIALSIDLQLLSVVVETLLLSRLGASMDRIGWLWRTYLAGVGATYCYWAFIHALLLGGRLPFLPLMVHSCYCAFGVLGLLLRFYVRFLRESRQKQA